MVEGASRYWPVCDGFEVINQAVGWIADGPTGVAEALYLRTFTDRLTVFMEQGESALQESERSRLKAAGIAWSAAPIDSVRLWNRRVTVRHGGLETVCDSVYCALGMRVRSELATRLGATADSSGY